ncbi:putative DNA binding domain-containing protein [bacterium]|nr:putative DNA binding domain-containing protein [bacterium]
MTISQSRNINAENEGQEFEQKSLRYVLDKIHKDMHGLAGDCVGLANSNGGKILIGIEDGQDAPPPGQCIPEGLPEQLEKRLSQITVNVGVVVSVKCIDDNEYIEIWVLPSRSSIAATTTGRYFLRVADETKPLMPDDLGRLITEKPSYIWELTGRRVPRQRVDPDKLDNFMIQIHESNRVSAFIKQKTEDEILEHYFFAQGDYLTNLGVLWIGKRDDRASLLYPPIVQCIKYDERGQKTRKFVWGDDYSMNPIEIINAVWRGVPDWQEGQELPDGLMRKTIPHYDEVVVRELLANALVHRPYTQRGDIFLNIFPDRLEIHNPGLLPIGVTPRNILHVTSKRNPHLAKVFYDLKLMEGEGSGFDRMYEVLLTSGKPAPEVKEGDDRVTVTVQRRIVKTRIADFVINADDLFRLTQKERITLGLIAQNESLTAIQITRLLELKDPADLRHWLGRLHQFEIIQDKGRTKGKEYYVDPDVLRRLDYKGKTTLKRIEDHRLCELILNDLEIYKRSSISEIHGRIGPEIPRRKLKSALAKMVVNGQLGKIGRLRYTQYLWTKTA